MTAHKLQVAQELYASGQYTVAAIAKTLGVSRASIYRHLTNADGRLGSSAHGATADRRADSLTSLHVVRSTPARSALPTVPGTTTPLEAAVYENAVGRCEAKGLTDR
jgi:transposase-like protein